MKNWWHQVPTFAILNAQIIGRIAADDNVQTAARASGVGGRYPLINSSFVTGLMYSILVVPRELYTLADAKGAEPTDLLIQDSSAQMLDLQARIDDLYLDQYLDVSIPNPKYNENPRREVVRLLRNSVAHVNYAIEGEPPAWSVRFWNTNEKGRNWEATCSVDKLQSLLLRLGDVLHNYYLKYHHG
jgi:hypothetical protein